MYMYEYIYIYTSSSKNSYNKIFSFWDPQYLMTGGCLQGGGINTTHR